MRTERLEVPLFKWKEAPHLTAVILSAFVFPGAGQFYLKQPVKGIIMGGVFIFRLSFHGAARLYPMAVNT